ncbi:MAG TPA: UDP-N-acetylmuramoyl-tripeptide--D-alanyl-D-alanine ligase, partial [Ideonella sp.]|nr:UDP-N-acetylmuramoyl-tripeptide--D-alanyl-D-alanine ligase [Ideonella sp.]
MMTLAQAQALVPGSVLVGDGAAAIARVHTDTRTLASGDLFVALKGEFFDAHDFLPQARAAGAVAAIASHGLAEAGLPGLQAPDTLAALQALARGWRAQHRLPLIAVTGSNGKTTVTQMIASILRAAHGDAALATAGNFNNHIGVPLTVLRLAAHQAAVVELGMNHPGEIAELAAIAQPTVALINNAQREHLEFMHSVEAVARENGSVIAALPSDGTAVFPADDAFTPLWRELAGERRVMSFALDTAADVTAQAQWQVDHWAVQLHTPAGDAASSLRVAGRHNVKNALAATASALAAGVALADVVRGLAAFEPVKGRSQVRPLARGGTALTLIDDTYNANPDSVRAAIDVLAALPAPRWIVLGDMGEVGDQGPAFHTEVGQHARASGIEHLWCAGDMASHIAAAYGPAA